MAAAGGHVGKLVSEMLTKGKIVPDVVAQLPPEVYNLVVKYREVEVENGVHLRVAGTQIKPHVELRGKGFGGAEDKWTLLMVDPDAPSPESPTARNFLHWLVVNIPGSTAPDQEIWETGKEVLPYMGPAPPAGVHRYVFLIFKEEGDLKIADRDRPNFDVHTFSKEHKLGDPKGGVYFLAKHGDDLDYPSRQA